MKYPIFLLLANAMLAQDAAKPPVPTTTTTTTAAAESNSKSIIMIDPKARANDYAQAFEFLRKDKPTMKVMIRTSDMLFMGVTDVTPSAGGTLLMIKVLSSQGMKTQIVPIEQVMEITYSP